MQSNEAHYVHLNARSILKLSCIPRQSTQYHVAVRSSRIPSVHTVPRGGQIIAHSVSPHSTTWRSDHRALHQTTRCHVVVRSSCIPSVNTVRCGGQITVLHGGQIIVHSVSRHSTTWRSDHRVFHQSVRCHVEDRS